MSKSILENLRKARKMHVRASVNNIQGVCMAITQRAFGVSPSAGGKETVFVRSNLDNAKLETSLHMRAEEHITPRAVRAMVYHPQRVVETLSQKSPEYVQKPFHKRRHLGLVVQLIDDTLRTPDHGYAILPPNRFSKNVGKQLTHSDAALTVDSGDNQTFFSATIAFITAQINKHISDGGSVDILFVQKKGRK